MTRFRQKVKGVGFEPKYEPSPPYFEQKKKKNLLKNQKQSFSTNFQCKDLEKSSEV